MKLINKILSGKFNFILLGLAVGLYPIFFYFNNNYTLVNSMAHAVFFLAAFILLPMLLFWVFGLIFSFSNLIKWKKLGLTFLSIFILLVLMEICIYAGIQKKISLLILLVSLLLAFLLKKQHSKIVLFQLVLALVGFLMFGATVIRKKSFSEKWKKQPDAISKVIFKKKPNIYFIQPDGYTNPSELKRGFYNLNNSNFESFLTQNNFKIYPNFRSNYASTLPSNSSIFMMKHHYYNKGLNDEDGLDARNVIIHNNTVLSIFKNNNYKTFFLTESPYFLINRPKLGYDYSNFSFSEIFLPRFRSFAKKPRLERSK